MHTVACTNSDTRGNSRLGRRLSKTPWHASKLKNTKMQAPAVAAKFAAITDRAEEFCCQWPDVTAANRIAQGTFKASTNTPKASRSAPDFARKIWRALTGKPAR